MRSNSGIFLKKKNNLDKLSVCYQSNSAQNGFLKDQRSGMIADWPLTPQSKRNQKGSQQTSTNVIKDSFSSEAQETRKQSSRFKTEGTIDCSRRILFSSSQEKIPSPNIKKEAVKYSFSQQEVFQSVTEKTSPRGLVSLKKLGPANSSSNIGIGNFFSNNLLGFDETKKRIVALEQLPGSPQNGSGTNLLSGSNILGGVLSPNMQHRKSINHNFFSQLHRTEQEKAKKTYFTEELEKVRHTWKVFEDQQQKQQEQQKQEHIKQQMQQGPLAQQENKKQQGQQEMNGQRQMAVNQRLEVVKMEGDQFLEELERIWSISQKKKKNYSEGNVWNTIVLRAYEILKEGKVVKSELTWEMFRDFLGSVMGCDQLNNVKYLEESVKLMGLTPEVSETICDKICRLMSESYGISSGHISKFQRLYRLYESEHLRWTLIDRMGGYHLIDEVIHQFITLSLRDKEVTATLRMLNIFNNQIKSAFYVLLSQGQLRHKQYFKHVEEFFRLPVYRVSHTKFFLVIQLYLKSALEKSKVQNSLRNRIFLLIEQLRFFVTLARHQDEQFFIKKQPNDLFGTPSNNQQQMSFTREDFSIFPSFCISLAIQMRNEFINSIKIKQALMKLPPNLSSKWYLENHFAQLIQIFSMNNFDSASFIDILSIPKLTSLLLLTDDFFSLFSKMLIESIRKANSSVYFLKDTHKRLQHVRILLNQSKMQSPQELESQAPLFNISANQQTNYMESACFFNDILDHPNPLELLLDKLQELYLTKIELNQLCSLTHTHRSRAQCRFILCYFYPFIDSNGLPEFVSAFDFQCFITHRKLKHTYFIQFRNVLKNLFISHLDFPSQLASRLLQEFTYYLAGFKFIDTFTPFQPNITPTSQLTSENAQIVNNIMFDLSEEESTEF